MTHPTRERGFVLAIALVMLVILTMLVVSAWRFGNTSLKVAGNMQVKEEAVAAAQQVTEQVISTNFTTTLTASPPEWPKQINVDVNLDGNTDYQVDVPTPSCTSTRSLQNADLDSTNPADASCISSGTANNTGLIVNGVFVAQGQAWCNQQTWDIEARVTDVVTGANVATHQGVAMRTKVGTDCP